MRQIQYKQQGEKDKVEYSLTTAGSFGLEASVAW
jgi:hypothetical protein